MARYGAFDVAPANLLAASFFQPGAIRTGSSITGVSYANPTSTIVALEAIGVAFNGLGQPTAGTVLNITLYAADFATQLAGFSDLTVPLVDFEAAWLGAGATDMFAFLLAGSDALRGAAADDTLTGHTGNDTIEGGAGVNTAAFAGASSLYTVGPAAGGITGITGPDGTDTLENIQFLSFADGIYALTPMGIGPVFSIAANATDTPEGTGATSTATFTVLNTGGTEGTYTIDWTLAGSGGNAADATDFTGGVLPGGSVTFNPGDTARTITIPINGDTALETNEAFSVTLAQPVSGAVFATATAFGTILNDDSAISIATLKANRTEGTGGLTPFTFALSAAGDTSTARTVTYVAAGATVPNTVPAQTSDFPLAKYPMGTVTFAPGEVSKTLTVNVKADTLGELNEAVTLTLFPWAGTTVGTASATGIILNDDTSLRIVSGYYSDRDEGGPALFTVQRSGNLTGTNAVTYATAGTGPTPPTATDFPGSAFPTGTVSFAPGETSKTIQIQSKSDSLLEPDEHFQVTLSAPTGGAAIDPDFATALGSIINDEALLTIAGVSAKPEASTGGTTAFTFTVTRTGDGSTTHSAKFAVTGTTGSGTVAATAADFPGGVFPTGTVSIPYGATKQTITINVNADKAAEFNERFAVTLSAPSAGAAVASSTAQGIIYNDDTALSIAATSASKPEGTTTLAGKTPFTFSVTRFGVATTTQSAKWAVTGLSRTGTTGATASDFAGGIFPSGTVTFAPGVTRQTITVNVSSDPAYELNESFSVTLSAPTGGAMITTATASATILDDDAIKVSGTGDFKGTALADTFVISGTTNSVLFPGSGVDKFLFLPAFPGTFAKTTIYDFAPGIGERIDLTRIDANPAIPANDAFIWRGLNTFTGTPGELRLVGLTASGLLFQGSLDSGIGADFSIYADTTATPTLNSSWFLL